VLSQPPKVRYPTEQGQDAVPMIKHLKYKDIFRPVMQQVRRVLMLSKVFESLNNLSSRWLCRTHVEQRTADA
jgi:hypothetical protein